MRAKPAAPNEDTHVTMHRVHGNFPKEWPTLKLLRFQYPFPLPSKICISATIFLIHPSSAQTAFRLRTLVDYFLKPFIYLRSCRFLFGVARQLLVITPSNLRIVRDIASSRRLPKRITSTWNQSVQMWRLIIKIQMYSERLERHWKGYHWRKLLIPLVRKAVLK